MMLLRNNYLINVLIMLHKLSHLIFTKTLKDTYCFYLQFSGEETEAGELKMFTSVT